MNMREKMARAMAVADSGPEGSALFDIHWREFGDGYLSGVDAALTALMEPTEGMTEAFSDRFSDWLDEIIEDPMHPYKMAIQAAREGK